MSEGVSEGSFVLKHFMRKETICLVVVLWSHYETTLGLCFAPSIGISLFSRIYSCVSVELIKESLFGFAGHCISIVPNSPVLSRVQAHLFFLFACTGSYVFS